jgi:hypothetical protein
MADYKIKGKTKGALYFTNEYTRNFDNHEVIATREEFNDYSVILINFPDDQLPGKDRDIPLQAYEYVIERIEGDTDIQWIINGDLPDNIKAEWLEELEQDEDWEKKWVKLSSSASLIGGYEIIENQTKNYFTLGEVYQAPVDYIEYSESRREEPTVVPLKSTLYFDLIFREARDFTNRLYCFSDEKEYKIKLQTKDGEFCYFDERSGGKDLDESANKIGAAIGGMYSLIFLNSSLDKETKTFSEVKDRLRGMEHLADSSEKEINEIALDQFNNCERRRVMYIWYQENCDV